MLLVVIAGAELWVVTGWVDGIVEVDDGTVDRLEDVAVMFG